MPASPSPRSTWPPPDRRRQRRGGRGGEGGGGPQRPPPAALGGRGEMTLAARYLVDAVRADPGSKEAQSALQAVMTAQGDRASAAYQRGIYSLETDRPDLAAAAFEQEAAIAPERVDGPRMASLAYAQMKRL